MPDDSVREISESEVSNVREPNVVARYSSVYKPPFDVTKIIERMVESVPPKYLVGLSEIVLTDQGDMSRKRRRSVTYSRKKKVRILNALGLYHPRWKGEHAWIEVFVDATLKRWEEGIWLKIPLLRELLLGDVLFHEIGHHIHFTVRPEYREKEDVADIWKVRLDRNYWRNRLTPVRFFFRLSRFFAGPLIHWFNLRSMKSQRQKGWISQAEFEERTRADPPKLS